MINFCIGVTSYRRPQGLMRIMTQLHQQRDIRKDIHVAYDDPDPPNMARSTVSGKGELHTPNEHCGADEYYRLVNILWGKFDHNRHDYFFFVQDDVSIPDADLLNTWARRLQNIEVAIDGVASLNLWGDGPDWNRTARWTGRPVVETVQGVCLAHWVDMVGAIFTPLAFRIVPRLVKPLPRSDRSGDSSGVGRQLSRRFDKELCAQLMVTDPVIEHADGGRSIMHPERYEQTDPETT